jgi:UDP-3-O-[3-hydroxymyristoyl] N-acetylglucosamine deacetylase/3-hydroxyacyl-[acyl-carrier-protein] dehydratase
MDGSAAAFVYLVRSAGLVEQAAAARVLRVRKPFALGDGARRIRVTPAPELRVTYGIDFPHPIIGRQKLEWAGGDAALFERELAGARTFAFLREVAALRDAGLARGGNLSNTVVLDENGVVNDSGLRFSDEFVRHKVLDLIGDLSLVGRPIQGHVHAIKAGHLSNLQFVRKLWEIAQKKDRIAERTATGHWDINLVQEIIPHRYPFLMVDKIIELEDRKRVVGIKNVTINEPFFQGHFPGHPIMPAVLIIEAMAQVGGVLLMNTVDNPDRHLVYFTRIDKARFRKPVRPGDQLRFEVELVALKRRVCKMKGRAYVGDDLVAESDLLASIVDK